ncbi:MAG: hypothetical protein VCC99_10550 [Alphaproteobacteria bacterium]
MTLQDGQRCRIAIEAYAVDPTGPSHAAKRLQGSSSYRIRVGGIRIIFELGADAMRIVDIGQRGQAYR